MKPTRSLPFSVLGLAAAALVFTSLPAAAQSATERTFQNWVVRCDTPAKGAQRCRLLQVVRLKDSGQRLIQVGVARVEGAEAPVASVVLPLGIYLPAGLTIQIDEGEALRAPIEQCARAGCEARLQLTEGLLAQMKAGKQAKYTFQNMLRKDVTIPAPLDGFTKAIAELK